MGTMGTVPLAMQCERERIRGSFQSAGQLEARSATDRKFIQGVPSQPRNQKLVARSRADLLQGSEVLLSSISVLGPRTSIALKEPRYAYFMENCRILL
jgi:hypothetical protein